MKRWSVKIFYVMLTSMIWVQVSCYSHGDAANRLAANTPENQRPAAPSRGSDDTELLQQVLSLVSGDESRSSIAWQNLQSRDRQKLINDLNRISSALTATDRNRVFIAFTLCRISEDYKTNRAVVLSALAKDSPYIDLFGDWTVTLVDSLRTAGDQELLFNLFEASAWSDGAMSDNLARIYSQSLASNPVMFVEMLSTRPEELRSKVLALIQYHPLDKDQKTKVRPYLKTVSPHSNDYELATRISDILAK